MTETWMLRGIVGGLLIGISASLVLVLNGRVTGISGILNALMRKPDGLEYAWRALFVAGLLGGALLLTKLSESDTVAPSSTVALVAGALVGVGTRLANGCTSGHGVCGTSRLSLRSLVATFTFIATGGFAVLALRTLTTGVAP